MTQNLDKRNGVYYFRGKIGGRLYRRSTGFSDLELAKRAAVEIENTLRSQRRGWITPDIPELKEWSKKWLKAYHPQSETEPRMISRFVEQHGHRTLNMLARSDFEAYFRQLEREGWKPGGMERVRVALSGMLKAAVEDGIIEKSPMRVRRYPKVPRKRVLTPEEETALMSELRPVWQRFVRTAILTGLRRSEILMARPQDLRSDGRMLGVRPESNKTKKARLVPVLPETWALLEVQRKARGPALDKDDRRYWMYQVTTPMEALRRACKRLAMPIVTVHDLRRTFGTRCARQGMYPKHLQEIMGHQDISITMKYYVHLETQDLLDALLKVTL